MKVKISKNKTEANFFDFEIRFKPIKKHAILQLPGWRPGRYELQNFAKNIQRIEAYTIDNQLISIKKVTKDRWEIASYEKEITVKYSYYANKTDAGSSFVSDEVFYLNFVNCLPYLNDNLNENVTIELELPANWPIACALKAQWKNNMAVLKASSIYELYDSPLIACPNIQSQSYVVGKNLFHIHIAGNYLPNWSKILPAFKAFTKIQIEKMGDFPVEEYHFINWILPNAYYHGAEHGASTMIVLGPDIEGDSLLPDLIGVSSHELFHAWNICKIRPIELLPYDFTKENYFDTGFIVEGVTTYFGDLFLMHAGVLSKTDYLKEISAVAMRHFIKDGNAKQSITETSIDLWIDGYSEGIPNKKVSIYQKGALLALILDLMIRNKFNHTQSLYSVMKNMWEKFGKFDIGYTLIDYKKIAEEVYSESLNEYFDLYIFGNEPINKKLNAELNLIGLELVMKNDNAVTISEIKKLNKLQKINLEKFLTDNKLDSI